MKKTLNTIFIIVLILVIGTTAYNFFKENDSVSTEHFDETIAKIKEDIKSVQDTLNINLQTTQIIQKTIDSLRAEGVKSELNFDSVKTGLQINFEETQKLTGSELTYLDKIKRTVRHSPKLLKLKRTFKQLF
jgi:uncharacterized protein YxeA